MRNLGNPISVSVAHAQPVWPPVQGAYSSNTICSPCSPIAGHITAANPRQPSHTACDVHQHRKSRSGGRADVPPEAEAGDERAVVRHALDIARGKGLHSSKYSTPTSSFAGGRHGTLIFAAVSGGSSGDGLLRAHHDAVIQPLLKRKDRPAARASSSSFGK